MREWAATIDRKTKHPIVEKQIITTRGALSFWSAARLDRTRQLLCTLNGIRSDPSVARMYPAMISSCAAGPKMSSAPISPDGGIGVTKFNAAIALSVLVAGCATMLDGGREGNALIQRDRELAALATQGRDRKSVV